MKHSATEGRIRTVISRQSEPVTEHIDFKLVDGKGRKIGCFVSRYEARFEPVTEDHSGGYTLIPPNVYFVARTQVTRDRIGYGSYQSPEYHLTESDREAWIERRVKSCRKTAEKNAVKP